MNKLARRSMRILAAVSVLTALLGFAVVPGASASPGADLAASISGPLRVRIGEYITYTITATNVGDQTATDVGIDAWVPDWFDFDSNSSIHCLGTTLSSGDHMCNYPDLAPGGQVSMTITMKATAGNKQERREVELGWAYASNDVNLDNNQAEIPVHMTGPCRSCTNK